MIKNKWKKTASKPALLQVIRRLEDKLKNMKERAEVYVKVSGLKAKDYKEQHKRLSKDYEVMEKELKRLKTENATYKKELTKYAMKSEKLEQELNKTKPKKAKKKKKVKKK